MRAYWLVPAAIAVGLSVFMADRESGVPAWLRARSELEASQGRIAELEARNAALRAEIRAWEEDPFALERAIREDLGLARSGEVVVRFSESQARE